MPTFGGSSLTASLLHLFESEEQACHHLLETLHQERTAIKTLAVEEFHPINRRRLEILETLQKQEEERRRLTASLAAVRGMPADSSLYAVLDSRSDLDDHRLRSHYTRLMALAQSTRREVQLNAALIEGVRAFLGSALDAALKVGITDDLYTASGLFRSELSRATIIRQQG